MAFSRAAALRSSLRCARATRPTIARPQLLRQVARRGYASGHEQVKSGGDLLWAIGGVAVTIPSCYYILTSIDTGGHGHDEHGEGHGEKHGEEHEAEEKEEGEEEKSEEKSEDAEDSDSGDEKEADTPDTSDDEGEDDSEGKNTKETVPDAKGGSKKRIESNAGKTQGEKPESDGDDAPADKAAPSKPAGGKNTQSGKQEGLSNTDTKHSSDIGSDSEKSTKADGQPETAKSKGTVDPKRPAV